MSEIELIRDMIRFDLWANRQMFEAVEPALELSDEPLRLLVHNYVSQGIWLNRMEGAPAEDKWFPDASFDEAQVLADTIERRWEMFLEKLDQQGVERSMTFSRRDGSEAQATVRDILVGLVTHSAHHRGQINLHLGCEGVKPSPANYISYRMI